ncbi:ATPase, partial [Streptomyces sp. NPDC006992]
KLGEALQGPLRAELAGRRPHARIGEAAGGPLEGALLVAARLADGALALPRDPALLSVTDPDAREAPGAPGRGAGSGD